VTIPHKEHLLRFVEERGGRMDALSEQVGAANTLVVGSAGGLACSNTDCPAAVEALCAGMQIEPAALAGMKIAILGAGGMARAAAAGFANTGANVILFNRTQVRARALAADLSEKGFPGKVVAGKPDRIDCGCFPVIVNCTPVGMEGGPAPEGSPLPDEMPIDERVTVFDTVYTPERTTLVQDAEARGARVITGVDLFLRQAALQFEAWTGCPAPMETFRKVMASP
jgi:3-dehydroquinate dehydratase/shikimate dehydrogenase